jgi:hypothetical protein
MVMICFTYNQGFSVTFVIWLISMLFKVKDLQKSGKHIIDQKKNVSDKVN